MNTKKTLERKKPISSFTSSVKEPVISRIAKLVERYPSRRQAAEAWELNYSTLQNYFKRAADEPNPRRRVLEAISQHEGVSIEWLLTGIDTKDKDENVKECNEWVHKKLIADVSTNESHDISRIVDLLNLLKGDDLSRLSEMLGLKGVETLLCLLDPKNQALLALREDKKRIALRLESMSEEQLREILSKIESSAEETISEVKHSDANIRARA